MSRPRGVGGGSDALSAVNKENPGKTAATSIGGAPLNRRPLQPCGNTAANRTTKTPAAKADDAGESAAGAEEGVDEMPPREFDGLCYSCEDDEWWKQEMHTACEALRDLNGQWNVRMKTLTRLRYLVMVRDPLSVRVYVRTKLSLRRFRHERSRQASADRSSLSSLRRPSDKSLPFRCAPPALTPLARPHCSHA